MSDIEIIDKIYDIFLQMNSINDSKKRMEILKAEMKVFEEFINSRERIFSQFCFKRSGESKKAKEQNIYSEKLNQIIIFFINEEKFLGQYEETSIYVGMLIDTLNNSEKEYGRTQIGNNYQTDSYGLGINGVKEYFETRKQYIQTINTTLDMNDYTKECANNYKESQFEEVVLLGILKKMENHLMNYVYGIEQLDNLLNNEISNIILQEYKTPLELLLLKKYTDNFIKAVSIFRYDSLKNNPIINAVFHGQVKEKSFIEGIIKSLPTKFFFEITECNEKSDKSLFELIAEYLERQITDIDIKKTIMKFIMTYIDKKNTFEIIYYEFAKLLAKIQIPQKCSDFHTYKNYVNSERYKFWSK
jgi:hypothetical protein